MEMVLLAIAAAAVGRLFSRVRPEVPEQAVCAGVVLLCLLMYLVSRIPVVLWPLIIWVGQ